MLAAVLGWRSTQTVQHHPKAMLPPRQRSLGLPEARPASSHHTGVCTGGYRMKRMEAWRARRAARRCGACRARGGVASGNVCGWLFDRRRRVPSSKTQNAHHRGQNAHGLVLRPRKRTFLKHSCLLCMCPLASVSQGGPEGTCPSLAWVVAQQALPQQHCPPTKCGAWHPKKCAASFAPQRSGISNTKNQKSKKWHALEAWSLVAAPTPLLALPPRPPPTGSTQRSR